MPGRAGGSVNASGYSTCGAIQAPSSRDNSNIDLMTTSYPLRSLHGTHSMWRQFTLGISGSSGPGVRTRRMFQAGAAFCALSSSLSAFTYEDFSASASNFTVSGGTWNVTGGRYVLSSPAGGSAGLLGNISIHDTDFTDDYYASGIVNITGTASDWNDAAFIFGYQDANNFYYVSLNESDDGDTKGIFKVVGGSHTELVDLGGLSISSDTDYLVSVQRTGSSIVVHLNGTQVASTTDSTFTGGQCGFGTRNDSAQFDNLFAVDEALFYDDFTTSASESDYTATGGTWAVSSGRYVLSSPVSGSTGLLGNLSVHDTSLSGDYAISAVVRITGTVSDWNDAAVVFGYQDVNNYYYVSLNESNDGDTSGLFKVVGGTHTELDDLSQTVSADVDYTVDVIRSGSGIVVYLNGVEAASASDAALTGGQVGFGSRNDGSQFDDLVVYGTAGGGSGGGPLIDDDFATSASESDYTEVAGGSWAVSGGRYLLSSPASGSAGLLGNILVHNSSFGGDYEISTVVRITGTGSDWDDVAVVFGYQNSDNYYYVSLNESDDGDTNGLFKVVGGTHTELDNLSQTVSANTDYTVEIVRSGSSIVVYLNSTEVASASDSTLTGGRVGFGSRNDGAQFDDLVADGAAGSGSGGSDGGSGGGGGSGGTPELYGLVGDWAFVPNIIAADYDPPSHNKTATPANVVSQIANLQSGDVLLLQDGNYNGINIEILGQDFASDTYIVAESYLGAKTFDTFAAYQTNNLILEGIEAERIWFNQCSNCEWHYLKGNELRIEVRIRNGTLQYNGGLASELNQNWLVTNVIGDNEWATAATSGRNTAQLGYTENITIRKSMFVRATADNFKLRGWQGGLIDECLFWGSRVDAGFASTYDVHNDNLQGEGYSGYENDDVEIRYSAAVGLDEENGTYRGSQGFFIKDGTNTNFLIEQCMAYPTQNSNGFAFQTAHANSTIRNCSGFKSTFRVSGSSNAVIDCAGQRILVESGASSPSDSGNEFYVWDPITDVFQGEEDEGEDVDSFELQPGISQTKGAYDLLDRILTRRAAALE